MLRLNLSPARTAPTQSSGFLATVRRSIIFRLLALSTTSLGALLLGGCVNRNDGPVQGYIGPNISGNVELPDIITRGLIYQAGLKVHPTKDGIALPGRVDELCEGNPNREKLHEALRPLAIVAAVQQIEPSLSPEEAAGKAAVLAKNNNDTFPLTPNAIKTTALICGGADSTELVLALRVPFNEETVRETKSNSQLPQMPPTPPTAGPEKCNPIEIGADLMGQDPIEVAHSGSKTISVLLLGKEAGRFVSLAKTVKLSVVTIADDDNKTVSDVAGVEATINELLTQITITNKSTNSKTVTGGRLKLAITLGNSTTVIYSGNFSFLPQKAEPAAAVPPAPVPRHGKKTGGVGSGGAKTPPPPIVPF